MDQVASYVEVDSFVESKIDELDIQALTSLIQSAITLTLDYPLEEVINSLSFTSDNKRAPLGGPQVNITLDVDPEFRSVVFGKKFSNIVCLRKLISNISGKREMFYALKVEE